jgi:hypothetical protein
MAGRAATCYGQGTFFRAAMSSSSLGSSAGVPESRAVRTAVSPQKVAGEPTGRTVCLFVLRVLPRIDTMTYELNRIEIELVPLTLFPSAQGKGRSWVPASPLQVPPDGSSWPNTVFEAHLMTFSTKPCETITPPWGEALHAWRSAFTLYVTGTRFGLWCYSLGLVRLVEDFENLCPSVSSATMH